MLTIWMIYDLTLCDSELDMQEESGIPSQHLDHIIYKYFLFSTLNRKLDGAILCILDKQCLNETTFHETESWFAVREKQYTKQVIFSILTLP